MLLPVKRSNPTFGIQSGPEWSPDGDWILFHDGRRLLLTTVDGPARTRVLATGVSGGASAFGKLDFAITPAE